MVVEATCHDCNDAHPVGDRPRRHGTTGCPRCGSPSYESRTTDRITKPDRERIADAVRDVPGVGPDTRTALVEHFGHYPMFEAAHAEQLEAVEGVGSKTAAGILEAVHGQ